MPPIQKKKIWMVEICGCFLNHVQICIVNSIALKYCPILEPQRKDSSSFLFPHIFSFKVLNFITTKYKFFIYSFDDYTDAKGCPSCNSCNKQCYQVPIQVSSLPSLEVTQNFVLGMKPRKKKLQAISLAWADSGIISFAEWATIKKTQGMMVGSLIWIHKYITALPAICMIFVRLTHYGSSSLENTLRQQNLELTKGYVQSGSIYVGWMLKCVNRKKLKWGWNWQFCFSFERSRRKGSTENRGRLWD